MAFIHGRLGYFKLATTDLSAFMDNIDFPHEADAHETTTFGKSYKTKAGGLKEGSFTIGGLYDNTVTTGLGDIIPPLVGTVAVYEFGPEGLTAGKKKYSGSALVKKFQVSQPVGDMVRWTADLETSDTITMGVMP
jgi:hypothetical protein